MPQPNILFLFPDQHRFDWVGVNKALCLRTPHLNALMERGTTFTHCYTPAPLCSPARACLATGRGYERCGVSLNGDNTPPELPNYYRNLQNAGYEVCGTGKFDLSKPSKDWGLDGTHMLSRYGFTCGCNNEGKGDAIMSYKDNDCRPKGPYMQYLQEQGLVEEHVRMYEEAVGGKNFLNYHAITNLPQDAYCDNWIANKSKEFLKGFAKDQPWHLVVNFTGPHDPYDVTQDMADAWADAEFPDPTLNHDEDVEGVHTRRRYYAAMIENIDRHMGELLSVVEARGELDNTIVVFCSDHGEMLGDHDRWAKSSWHEGSTHVPLVIAGPGIQKGAVSDALVSVHDLAPTFLDFANAKAIDGLDHESDARSLSPTLEDPSTPHRQVVRSGLNVPKDSNGWRMARNSRYKLVRNWELPWLGEKHDGSDLLFDLEQDPFETSNIASILPEKVEELAPYC